MRIGNIEVLHVAIEITPPKKPMTVMCIEDSSISPMSGHLAVGIIPETKEVMLGFKLGNGLQVGCLLTKSESAAICDALSHSGEA